MQQERAAKVRVAVVALLLLAAAASVLLKFSTAFLPSPPLPVVEGQMRSTAATATAGGVVDGRAARTGGILDGLAIADPVCPERPYPPRAARIGRPDRPNLIYVKVPKTGGSTLAGVVRRVAAHEGLWAASPPPGAGAVATEPLLASWLRAAGRAGRATGNVFANHAPYAPWLDALLPRAVRVTALRDPLDRLLSHYYFFEHRDRGVPAARLRADTQRKVSWLARHTAKHGSEMFAYVRGAAATPRAALCQYDFVAVTGRFDASLVALSMLHGLPLAELLHVNAKNNTRARPPLASEPAAARAAVDARVRDDAALYRLANARLDALVAQLRPRGFDRWLRVLRGANAEAARACAGDDPGPPKDERKCYWGDNGCAYPCLDRVSAAPAFVAAHPWHTPRREKLPLQR